MCGEAQPNRKRRKGMEFLPARAIRFEGKMESEPWEEALDVDDSDLSNFLRPCNRQTSKTPTADSPLIPGPAGVVQAAMVQRRTLEASNPLPTQEFVRRVIQNGHDTDRDFNSNPWLSALQFLPSQVGVVDDGNAAAASATPLSSIKKHLNVRRVPLVVAVIKSCTPNGFGDMTVTLKDPTGTVGASVHRRVFAEGEFGKDITVGSVVLLQKVALFSPNGSTCYLNITLPNIVKVFSKESGPPSEQISVKRAAPITTETHEKSWMPRGSAFSLPQERTEEILTNIRLDSRLREVANNGQQRDEILVLTSCHSDNGNDRNQNTVSNRENISLRQDDAGTVEVPCGGELENEMKDQPSPPKLVEGDNLAAIAQGSSSSTTSVHIPAGQENGMKNHLEIQKKIINPKSSVPHWTEEQLDELFAFD